MEDVKPVKIKTEADLQASDAEDDVYEDAGDLEFYDPNTPGTGFDSMYLARIPPYLWAAWDKFGDDEEIQIGQLRTWVQPDGKGNPKQHMKLLIGNNIPQHQGIPKEYNLELQHNGMQSKNLFVFSEQDLPGYAEKNKQRLEAQAAGIPASLLRKKEREEKPDEEQPKKRGKRKREEYFRKAIPKKTAIYGRVKHELHCTSADNPETRAMLIQRSLDFQKPATSIQFGDIHRTKMRIVGGTAGGIAGQDSSLGFITTAPPPPPKVKKSENKTARMPENELLDQIFLAFRDYRFYSLKAMRNRIPQPETYLRSTLEKVAFLHKAGKWASNWELRGEEKQEDSATGEAQAAEPTGEESDEEDLKLEDVTDVRMEDAT